MKKLIVCSILLSFSFYNLPQVVNANENYKISLKNNKKNNLIGNWQSLDESSIVLIVNSNTLIFNDETLNYSLSGNLIKVDSEEGVVDYPYKLNGDILTISFPTGFDMSFKKISNKKTNNNVKSNNQKNQNNQSNQNYMLQGNFCSYSSSNTYSSSYSSQNKVFFDGNGKFYYGGTETSMSADIGQYYGNSSSQNVGSYKVMGNIVYLTDSEGGQDQAQVHFTNSSGISELMYNGKLYGKGLCG